jgi:hypothetical protein
MSPRASILVVANRTADSPELIAALRHRAARSPARFTLLVPAVPRGLAWAADMKAGEPDALPRAEIGARRMRMTGLAIDEAIVSTLPRGVSRWLRLSLPHRLRRMTDVPVLHVTAHPRPARRSSLPRQLAGARS